MQRRTMINEGEATHQIISACGINETTPKAYFWELLELNGKFYKIEWMDVCAGSESVKFSKNSLRLSPTFLPTPASAKATSSR